MTYYTAKDLYALDDSLSPTQRGELSEASRDILKNHKGDLIRGELEEAGFFAATFALVDGPSGVLPGAAAGYIAHKINEVLAPEDYARLYPDEFEQAVEKIIRKPGIQHTPA